MASKLAYLPGEVEPHCKPAPNEERWACRAALSFADSGGYMRGGETPGGQKGEVPVRYTKLVVAVACAAVALPVCAEAADDPSAEARLRQMLACNAITDQAARVACYDAEAKQALAAGAKAAPPAEAAPAPAAARADRSFGAETVAASRRPAAEPKQARTLNARVVTRSDNGLGYYLYELDNGTQWQMTEKSPLELPRAGDGVTIRRGLFGGYMMDVGKRAAVRVTRVL